MQVYEGSAMGAAAGGGFGGCDAAVAGIEKFLADDRTAGPCADAIEDAAAGLHSHQIQTTTSSACHLLPSSCHGQPEAAVVMASALMQSLTNDHLLLGGSSNAGAMASSFGCFPLISCPSSMAPISPPSHSMLMVAADKNPSQQQQQDPSTITKKREERDRAKLRYNEKKKNRKCVPIHLFYLRRCTLALTESWPVICMQCSSS